MKTKKGFLILLVLFILLCTGSASAADNNTTNDTSNYSTYLGGSGTESANDVVVDKEGNVYTTGSTSSSDFPTTNGTYRSNTSGSGDIFVNKFSSNGTLIFSTYFGGSGSEGGSAITLDNDGNIYITGQTKSFDFPTTPDAYQTSLKGGTDIFIVKLSPDAGTLLYSSYFGGNSTDTTGSSVETSTKITLDKAGNIYLIGQTNSQDFPTTPDAYKKNVTMGSDGIYWGDVFLTRFDSKWNIMYSTLLGGSLSVETPYGIVLDNQNNIWITGKTTSSDFPTTIDACQSNMIADYSEAFLTKFSSNGTLLYSTYFGGNGNDYGYGLAVDNEGNVYITGQTTSTDLKVTSGAYQTTRNGSADMYIAKFNSSGNLAYCTYFGGTGGEDSRAIAIDSQGNIYLTGRISSIIPLTSNALQSTLGGNYDSFLTKMDSNITKVLYSTILGGKSAEFGYSVGVDSEGNVYVVGTTSSTNFPTTEGAYQKARSGSNDAFLTKIATAPTVNVSNAGGLYNLTQNVTLRTNENSTIYYTTDGSDPTKSTTRNAYGGNILIDHDTTLKFAAVDNWDNWSPIYVENYVIDVIIPDVAVNVKSGIYNTTQNIVLNTTDNHNTTTYYTIDGTNPMSSTSRKIYTSAILLDSTTTLKFIALDDAGNWSPVYTEYYVVDNKAPSASVSVLGGLYGVDKFVRISASENGTIYYTLDGSKPTVSSNKYTGPIKVSSSKTLRYVVVDRAGNKSPVYSQRYVIDKVAPVVKSTTPKRGVGVASLRSSIVIKFSEKIKKSINWSKVYVKNLKTGKKVSIKKWVKWNKLYIKMSRSRFGKTKYVVYIPKSAIKDSLGNKLAKKYVFKFKTAPY